MCGGCAAVLDKAKKLFLEKVVRIKKPEAKIVSIDLDVSRDAVTLRTKISVTNPYLRSLPVSDIFYAVKSADRTIVSGKVEKTAAGTMQANEETVLEVPVKVEHTILLSLVKDIDADWDIDYQLDLDLTIDLPLFGDLTIPLSRKGQIKLPTISSIF